MTFASRGCSRLVDSSHSSGGFVTFAPGARTAWHSHPAGQILIVTTGTGRVQLWGQPIEEIRAGDVVRIPAGVKHWHGASPRASMTHLGITEVRDGTAVQWMEKVTDEQYSAAVPGPQQGSARPSGELQQRIAPGLATLTDNVLYGDVWQRPELSPRDRSLVTISVLIATGNTAPLDGHLNRAFTNGVKPSEASALLAHLAIYCGWPRAVSALEVYDQVLQSAEHRRQHSERGESATSGARVGGGARDSDADRIGDHRAEVRPADQRRSLRDSVAAARAQCPRSQPRDHRRARRDGRRRPARRLSAPWSRERSDPRADRRGIDASGLLCRLAQGGEGVECGRKDASPLTERDASGLVVYLSRRALNLGLRLPA